MDAKNRNGQPATLVVVAPEGLCLDFANTRQWRGRPEPVETLKSAPDLLDWLRSALHPPEALAQALIARWEAEARSAEADLAAAIALRETIQRIFDRVAQGMAPEEADLDGLNQALATLPARRGLARSSAGVYGWNLALAPPILPDLLAPILWSAADLLVKPQLGRVRRCANRDCLWLFVDDSKSGNRRWCSMSSCGNRAKAQRHYRRRKGAAQAAG
ncbi:MAG: ABATE domain-containing protein [Alphaproteobacteria bacterium]|nr:ABATE domain-containing protein [Alphaproteobacteria bacterium]